MRDSPLRRDHRGPPASAGRSQHAGQRHERLSIRWQLPDDGGTVVNTIDTGASAYLMKSPAPAAPLDSSPELARRFITLLRRSRSPEHGSCPLTPRESELLKLMVEGHHYKTAAQEMSISTNTVSFHLKNIYDKLQVHSKTEAVAKALRERLTI